MASRALQLDGSLNTHFIAAMRPYVVRTASVDPRGPCRAAFLDPVSGDPAIADTAVEPASHPVTPDAKASSVNGGDFDLLLYVLLPLGIIAFILLVILVVVCCREIVAGRRRRRSREAGVKDSSEVTEEKVAVLGEHAKQPPPPSTSSSTSGLSTLRCASRGIPVIFADELLAAGNSNGDELGRAPAIGRSAICDYVIWNEIKQL